jgi:hypothetical protein
MSTLHHSTLFSLLDNASQMPKLFPAPPELRSPSSSQPMLSSVSISLHPNLRDHAGHVRKDKKGVAKGLLLRPSNHHRCHGHCADQRTERFLSLACSPLLGSQGPVLDSTPVPVSHSSHVLCYVPLCVSLNPPPPPPCQWLLDDLLDLKFVYLSPYV